MSKSRSRPAAKRRAAPPSSGAAARERKPARPRAITSAAPLPVPATRRAWAITALVLLAVWLAAFGPQILMGRTYVLGDAREFRTYSEFSRSRWLQLHERTFWNPYVFAGIPASPSLADSRPQYLPDALIDLYEKVRMPRVCPLAALLLAHLAGMLAAAALAQRLWGAGAGGMIAAGLVWGLCPILLGPFTFGHDARLVSSSLMPVILLALHAVITARSTRGTAAASLGLALVLAVQVLTGHPQIVIYSAMLTVAFAIEEGLRYRRIDRWAWAGAAAVFAAVMAAAVWLPALDYSGHSFRGGQVLGREAAVSLMEVKKYSNGFRDLIAIAWPRALGAGDTYWGGMRWIDYPQYMGLAALLAALLVWRTGPRPALGAARLMGATLGVALLVSLGTSLGPLYTLLQGTLPLWSNFRVPAATLLVGQLALALLVARAFTPEAAGRPLARSTWLAVAIALAAAFALGLALVTGALQPLYVQLAHGLRPMLPVARAARGAHGAGTGLLSAALFAAVALAALVARSRGGAIGRVANVALVAALALDLGVITQPLLTRGTGLPAELAPPPPRELVRLTAADHTARAFPARNVERDLSRPLEQTRMFEFASNYWIPWRARSLAGNHGAVPAVWRPIVQRELTRWYPVAVAFGSVYLAADSGAVIDSTLYTPVPNSGTPPVYRLRGALGRVYAVELVAGPGSDEEVVDAMASPDFVPRLIAFASNADRDAIGSYSGSPQCTIRWIRDDPDRIELETRAPAPAFVVLADTWFPGWSAQLDGAPLKIHRVNQVLRGMAVPAGTHRVTMTYVPEGWITGVVLTRVGFVLWIALVLALGFVAVRGRRGRRDASQSRPEARALDPVQTAP